MKKNLLLSFAEVFAFVGFFGIVGVVIGNETNIQTHEVTRPVSSNWEKDFKWFDVEMKLKSGSVEKISIGIPLKDIDFSKVEKYDASFATPLSLSFNLCWIIKQGNPLRDKDLLKKQFHVPPATTIDYLDQMNDNEKLLDALYLTCRGKNPKDFLLCFAIIEYKSQYIVMRRCSNINFTNKLGDTAYYVENINGQWKSPVNEIKFLDEITTVR